MASTRFDRRALRTRHALQRALLSLISEKDYEAVTVEEICTAANVGRSTFYLHFSGKDDLKRSGLRDLHDTLLKLRQERSGAFAFSLPLLRHAEQHQAVYRALVGGRGGAVALGTIRAAVCDLLRKGLANEGGQVPSETTAQFLTGAYMALLTWWLDAGARLPAEELDATYRLLASAAVGAGRLDPAATAAPTHRPV